jgi:hypothetical protein
MTTKQRLILLLVVFLIIVSIKQCEEIQKEPLVEKPQMLLSADGKLITPPLSGPTISNMNDCRACKIHASK